MTVNGRKIGKSLGNAIDPIPLIEEYGSDAIRYYLIEGIPAFADGDFNTNRLANLYNSDLANGIGNLVNRVLTLCRLSQLELPPLPDTVQPIPGHEAAFLRYDFGEALQILWQRVSATNQDIERQRPWELLRESRLAELQPLLERWLGALHCVAHWLQPFLPETAATILNALRARPISVPEHLFPRR